MPVFCWLSMFFYCCQWYGKTWTNVCVCAWYEWEETQHSMNNTKCERVWNGRLARWKTIYNQVLTGFIACRTFLHFILWIEKWVMRAGVRSIFFIFVSFLTRVRGLLSWRQDNVCISLSTTRKTTAIDRNIRWHDIYISFSCNLYCMWQQTLRMKDAAQYKNT